MRLAYAGPNQHDFDVAEYREFWGKVMMIRFTDIRCNEGPGALWMWEIGGDFPAPDPNRKMN